VFVPIALATILYFSLGLWMRLPQAKDVLGVLTSRLKKKA
jgi:hypothetical protein